MKNWKTLIIFLVLLTGCAAPQTQRSILATPTKTLEWYISTTGSDSNAGTITNPFKTATKALGIAQSGDTVYFRAGTYPAFYITKSNIIVSSYNGESVIISGGSGIRCSNKASGVTIRGFEVIGAQGNYMGAITFNGCSNGLIESNIVHDNVLPYTYGIKVENGSNNKLLHNIVYNNYYVGIGVSGTSINNEVAFNEVYNHTLSAGDGDGISLFGTGTTGTNIHDNVVYKNSDDGIDTWNSPANAVINNLAYSNGGTGDGNGIKVGGSGAGGNNIVIGNVSHSNYLAGFTSNGNGNYYENNTAFNNGKYGFVDYRDAGNTQKSTYINNIAYSNPTNFKYVSSFVSVFTGNSTAMPGSVTLSPTISTIVTPIKPITAIPTTQTPTPTPTKTLVPATPAPTAIPTVCFANYVPPFCIVPMP